MNLPLMNRGWWRIYLLLESKQVKNNSDPKSESKGDECREARPPVKDLARNISQEIREEKDLKLMEEDLSILFQ